MDWYRAYHGMPQNTTLRVVAHRTKLPMASVLSVWVCLLDMASQNNPRGNVLIDAEQIAVLQNLETEDVVKIINAFYEKNLLTLENRLTNWDKRQYTTPTERSKKSRSKTQRHATPRNAVQRDATPGNAAQHEETQKKTDTENREQIADTEGRNADSRVDAEAEKKQKTESDKRLKTHTEKREREREKHKTGGQATGENQIESQTGAQKQSQTQDDVLQQLLDIWNDEVQSKLTIGQKAKLTEQRKELLIKRWVDDFNQDIRAWRYYCEIIGSSQFCLGKREGKEGKAWTIDLSWAVASSDNVARIMEGGFSGGNHPRKPPACNVPELQLAWDTVLEAFQQKYSKATCRSWLSGVTVTRMQWICDGRVVTLLCPNKFTQEWIAQHYLPDISQWFVAATKNDARVARVELVMEG